MSHAERQEDYGAYYAQKLDEAQRFQDFVVETLYRHGWPLVVYSSQESQLRGETMAGVEIKYDQRLAETGNLYIEVAEKAHPSRPVYTPSGIYRNDNTWLWLIGDRTVIYGLPKKYLQKLHHKCRPVQIPTSKGFLLPRADAEKYAAVVYRPNP